MWNLFKNNLTESIDKNIPHQMLTYKHRLPWVHNKLRKMINKKNKLYFKMTKDKKYKEKYKQVKHQVQKEQRHAYNTLYRKNIRIKQMIQIKVLITNRSRKNSSPS